MTSRYHVCLFTKKACFPCQETKEVLHELFVEDPDYGALCSVLQKENHSALVAAYDLEMYPTLLLVDSEGTEMTRLVGGAKVRKHLAGILLTIKQLNHETCCGH